MCVENRTVKFHLVRVGLILIMTGIILPSVLVGMAVRSDNWRYASAIISSIFVGLPFIMVYVFMLLIEGDSEKYGPMIGITDCDTIWRIITLLCFHALSCMLSWFYYYDPGPDMYYELTLSFTIITAITNLVATCTAYYFMYPKFYEKFAPPKDEHQNLFVQL